MAKPVTLVTGVSRGIGLAVARDLAARGHHVLGLSRTAPADFPGEFHAVDLLDADAMRATLAGLVARHPVHRLVNNAGMIVASDVERATMADYERMMDLNVRAVLLAMQAVLPAMRAARFGRIVNIGSRAGLGKDGRAIYGASKAAVLALTRAVALETAKDGITVNCVAPGPIETELLQANYPAGSPRLAGLVAQVPARRMGRPAEVAHAVAYFLDEGASYTTGQVLYVCGGMSVGQAPV